MKNPSNILTSFDDHLNKKYGQKGTSTRETYEKGYEVLKTGVLSQILQEDQQHLEKLAQKPD